MTDAMKKKQFKQKRVVDLWKSGCRPDQIRERIGVPNDYQKKVLVEKLGITQDEWDNRVKDRYVGVWYGRLSGSRTNHKRH